MCAVCMCACMGVIVTLESNPYAWHSLLSPEYKVISTHTIPNSLVYSSKAHSCHFEFLYRNHQYAVDCKFLEAKAWFTLKIEIDLALSLGSVKYSHQPPSVDMASHQKNSSIDLATTARRGGVPTTTEKPVHGCSLPLHYRVIEA